MEYIISQATFNFMSRVNEALQNGYTSIEEIKKYTGVSEQNLRNFLLPALIASENIYELDGYFYSLSEEIKIKVS